MAGPLQPDVDTKRDGKPGRLKWVAGISLVVAAIAGLSAWAFLSPGALASDKTPSEIVTGVPVDGTVRVGGRLVNGTLERNGTLVRFTVTDGDNTIPVVFRGEVPDTLKEGTDVIAEGTIGSGRTMHASRVQAKCSSKFVPKDRPGDLGRAEAQRRP